MHVSKARFALNIKKLHPKQLKKKRCSLEYWIYTIDTVCQLEGINDNVRKQNAIDKYDELINN